MRGGQVAALVAALILLLPGLCFLAFGTGFVFDQFSGSGGGELDLDGLGLPWLIIAAVILGVAALLFRVALKKPKPPGIAPAARPPGEPPGGS
jgi:hypothetical protein